MLIEGSFPSSLERRAALHRALGDEHRLRLVDCLAASDRSPGELGELTGMPSNLVAFHLRVLEQTGVVERRRSEGDSRRRYVRLIPDTAHTVGLTRPLGKRGSIVFVCTHNSARSQFAEALWRSRAGGEVWSAGTEPADRVHPEAVEIGRRLGLDLSDLRPKGYQAIPGAADLVVSVCDRASESGIPVLGERMHWSVPDPVGRGAEAFESAFADIADRVDRLCPRG